LKDKGRNAWEKGSKDMNLFAFRLWVVLRI
jgi:hypothetical protein